MTRLELFEECTRGRWYQQTRFKVDWKVVGDRMYFRQSVEAADWVKNLLAAIPCPLRLAHGWRIVPLGAAIMWLEIRGIVREKAVAAYIGYSQGGLDRLLRLGRNRPSCGYLRVPGAYSRGCLRCLHLRRRDPLRNPDRLRGPPPRMGP